MVGDAAHVASVSSQYSSQREAGEHAWYNGHLGLGLQKLKRICLSLDTTVCLCKSVLLISGGCGCGATDARVRARARGGEGSHGGTGKAPE